jgi:hypothetical protein
MTQKSLIKMQILPIKNPNFEKPSRNLSNKTKLKILRKKFFWTSLKKNLVPRMLSHCGNVRTLKFWRKSKEKKRNFFRKFKKGISGFDLGKKKFKIISCLCTFKILVEDLPKGSKYVSHCFIRFLMMTSLGARVHHIFTR